MSLLDPPQKMFKMIFIYEIRWIEHAFKATSRIFLHYEELLGHLSTIFQHYHNRQSYGVETQKSAMDMINLITHKHFLSSLAIMLDVQEAFRVHSLYYQRKEETIIGQLDRREKFLSDLQRLRRLGAGTWSTTLLKKVHELI